MKTAATLLEMINPEMVNKPILFLLTLSLLGHLNRFKKGGMQSGKFQRVSFNETPGDSTFA